MKIIIIGGGAAGFFSAIHNKQNNPDSTVVIIEKNSEVLSKVKISGGGRCNVTHACFDPKLLGDYYPRGAKELRGPFFSFQPKDTMAWFTDHGVPLKIESDNRVFPVSNSSQDIIDCLVGTATKLGVKIWTDCEVSSIKKEKDMFCLSLKNNDDQVCQKLVLATGSGRKGHAFAERLGHTIVSPVPSLFTFKVADKVLHELSGLSVNDAEVWMAGQKKHMQTGPLLITHWGLSGPSVIKLSAWQARALHAVNYHVSLIVNWLPSLDEQALKKSLIIYQHQNPKKQVVTQSPFAVLPSRLWVYLVYKSKIESTQAWHNLSSKQMNALLQELGQGQYDVTGKGQFKEEFVTCGGVSLKEVNFKTMESRRCKGLHIVGELLDIDGVTGGFNFQNAWTTGFLSS
jgi:predicted Rossmann fold flavoprotein